MIKVLSSQLNYHYSLIWYVDFGVQLDIEPKPTVHLFQIHAEFGQRTYSVVKEVLKQLAYALHFFYKRNR